MNSPSNRKSKQGNSVEKSSGRPELSRKSVIVTLALSFSIAFGLYLSTLAPTVTFEDSGELIAAAFNLGIPHQPGYPLFTLLGRVFSMLPIQNVAYRLNLMSALFSALGALFLTWTTLLLITEIRASKAFNTHLLGDHSKKSVKNSGAIRSSQSDILPLAASLTAGILMSTAFENWEQSIITEVYGLNSMFTSLVLLLAVAWHRQPARQQGDHPSRWRIFLLISYVLGLTLSNHTTSLMFIPILFIYAFFEDRKFILNPKILISGAVFMLLGLTPYIYLPIASARNPLMDWGNPENWTNFWRTISRQQYGLGLHQNFGRFAAQLAAYGDLLWQQWLPLFLLFAIIGLIVLFKFRRSYFYFMALFLFFAAPVTTFITDFDVSIPNPFIASEHKALVSVFYIPSYIGIALLAGAGIYYAAVKLIRLAGGARLGEYAAALVFVALPLLFAHGNYSKLDMSNYYFTEDYAENIFSTVPDSGIVFNDWDPHYFPLNYYQFVEKRRLDILAIDQELLRRSWYIQWLKDHYPGFIRRSEREVQEFLLAVKPFEKGEPFDGNYIQSKYEGMIKSFIDHSMESGRDIYFTYNPPPAITRRYFCESVVATLKLRKSDSTMTPVNSEALRLQRFIDDTVTGDRMSAAIKNYYGQLILVRAQQSEKLGDMQEALKWFTLAKKFFRDNPQILRHISASMERMEKQTTN